MFFCSQCLLMKFQENLIQFLASTYSYSALFKKGLVMGFGHETKSFMVCLVVGS